MTYVAPSTVTTLQTYTSAAHNVIVGDIIDHETRLNSYSGVYTNEAARDAAITGPVEGMQCYLTTPTIPAATGGTTYIPTGITTIYNGTGWVCVTPVSAYTSNSGTSASTPFTETLSGTPGTNPSVTVTTGATALISLYGEAYNSGSNANYIGISVSGATTIAGTEANAVVFVGTNVFSFAKTWILSGLTAGTNTFSVTYRVSAGTGTFRERRVTVQGIA